jgi:hypothetical protein
MWDIGSQFCDRYVYFVGQIGFASKKFVLRFAIKIKGTVVKAHPFYLNLAVDLTPSDLQGLVQVKDGLGISATLRTRLEALDLIEKALSGWRLTDQGSYRLSVGQGWQPSYYTRPDQFSN